MAGEKVLVIDDSEVICVGLKMELTAEGYRVDTALNGHEGIKLAKKNQYDLIFIDLVMPDMDGIQTCKGIKDASPESMTIFMTGRLDDNVTYKEIEFVEAGGKVYYLYKPFAEGEILEIARKALADRENEKKK